MMGLLTMAAPPTRRLAAEIRFDDGWWSVSVPELPGVFTHIVDRAGAEEAIREAIAFATDLDPSSFDIELVDA